MATVTKQVTLLLTYDDEVVGDPSSEWDWYQLLNADGNGRVKVELVG